MAGVNEKQLAQAAAEKDAVAYIDCVFYRRYAEHLPLATLLCDMRHLKNRTVLSYVGAMPFCQRAFLRTRTHLYRIYENQQIDILPRENRQSVMNLVDYVNARTSTTVADLYSFCSAAHPTLVKGGDTGTGLLAFRRFLDQHPTIFQIVTPAPAEVDRQEVRNQAVVLADVLLFPNIKIAVGRVINITGHTAYLECQGEFVTFHAVNAGLPTTEQLKRHLTKGDLVSFEARYCPDEDNGMDTGKMKRVWKALAVELPRSASSVCQHQPGPPVDTYLTPRTMPRGSIQMDDSSECCSRRGSSVTGQNRDSSTSSLAACAAHCPTGVSGLLTPPFSTLFSKHSTPFQMDAETQVGSGHRYVDKAVQTEVTDEELMLRLIRKYPSLLENLK